MKRPLIFALLLTPAAVWAAAPVWELKTGLDAPESAYYDPGTKLIYVSNVAGKANEKDGKGWISKVDLSGKMLQAQWVSGLNAPKGLRSFKGKLYAADIDQLIVIDLKSGAILSTIPAPGALMLNDVAVDKDGTVYASDTLGSRVYRFSPQGKGEVFASGAELQSPNGLFLRGHELMIAAWGLAAPDWSTKAPGRLLAIDLRSGMIKALTAPLGNLDGLEREKDGSWLTSDWVSGEVYRVTPKGQSRLLLSGFKHSADIGVVPEKGLLLVPSMGEGKLSAYALKGLK